MSRPWRPDVVRSYTVVFPRLRSSDSPQAQAATLFGSLWAIADVGQALAATLITIGVAISILPVLIRVLPPLARDAPTSERAASYAVTVVGLILYAVGVGGVIALINID